MSTPTSIPGWMTRTVPDSGYESPVSPDSDSIAFDGGILKDGERRRNGFGGNDELASEPQNQDSQKPLKRIAKADRQRDEDEDRIRRAGFRDRIGCYTWTWFTMTMATGGIANVLHSSNTPRFSCILLY
jgi:hypothetical protein